MYIQISTIFPLIVQGESSQIPRNLGELRDGKEITRYFANMFAILASV
jgi:hypothetical protein